MTEIIINVMEALKKIGIQMDDHRAYLAVETVLEGYNFTTKSTALVVGTDIPDKFKIFYACKRLDGVVAGSLKGYGYIIRRFSDVIAKPIAAITINDIRGYIHILTGRLKASSVITQINCFKSFFGWLRREKYISEDPTEGIKTPKPPKRTRKGLSVIQLEAVRNACQTPRDRALLEVLVSTGCRVSEIQKLRMSDIINNSIQVIGKGDKERPVFLNEKAMMYLKIYINSRKDKSDIIFTSERINKKTGEYQPIGTRAIENVFKRVGKLCGLRLFPHLMRHTCATMLIKNKAQIYTVQRLLGHVDPKTTQVYIGASHESLQMEHQQCAIA